MSRRTKVSELRERIVDAGGTPKGRTVADLLDEYQQLVTPGGGSVTPEQLEVAVGSYMERNRGVITDDDMDDIFGEG